MRAERAAAHYVYMGFLLIDKETIAIFGQATMGYGAQEYMAPRSIGGGRAASAATVAAERCERHRPKRAHA
jgi:hypothetical protein